MAVKASGFDSSTTVNNPQKDSLEASAKMVDFQVQQDNSYSELIDCLKMGGELPTVSGLSDQDYPGLSELGGGLRSLTQLNVVKKIPLPAELVEQFSLMQSCCQMGLFPEIGRAWLTIDSNIFLWSFDDGSDLAYFDGINEAISCVGLVKPKPGVFQGFIHYLLCLATPVEIILLGVSFSRHHESSTPFEEMHLLPEPLFSFPTDNTFMLTFQGSENGRIFLGGKDGCVYEFAYQEEDGWFTRKCRKINHSSSALSFFMPSFLQLAFYEDDGVVQIVIDDSRHILYARSEKGTIQVFDLGADGNQMSKVAVLHHQSIVHNAAAIAKTIDRKNFCPIVSISAVEAAESRHVNLVAVTQAGVRLYFTTNIDSGHLRPSTLALLHVRLPPGFSANATIVRPSNVHMSCYKKGFLLMASSQTEDHDVLFVASNDSFIFHPHLIETHTALNLDGRTWSLSEVPTSFQSNPLSQELGGDVFMTNPPLLITQHAELPRKFVFLSAQGCCIMTKPRPVDQLCNLLVNNKGPDCEAVKSFFKLHKEAQACAMCLILACNLNVQEKQIAEWATRAFFIYGGEPTITYVPVADTVASYESHLSVTQPLSPQPTVWASTPAQSEQSMIGTIPQPQFSNIYSPVKSMMSTPLNPMQNTSVLSQQLAAPGIHAIPSTETLFSGKHNGLYLYFSRIMRPLWNIKLVSDKSPLIQESGTVFLSSSVSSEEMAMFLQQLLALREFILQNHPFFGNMTNASSRFLGIKTCSPAHDMSSGYPQFQKKVQNDAELQERMSLVNLQQLVTYSCEALGLWKVLCDHQFETLVSFLSEGQRDQLKIMSFRDFIIDGKDLCGALATAVINFYLDDNASTGVISQRLRDVCPSIYRTEDATVSKAREMVLNAKNIMNKADKEKELMEALKLCKAICPNFSLESMCELFREAHFYHGIVDLCLCTAKRVDPQGLALHYYKNGEPPNDQQGLQVFASRMSCYKAVISTISDLVSQSMSHPQSPSVPKTPGPPLTRQPNALIPEEAKRHSELMFEMSLKTDDELFHAALYDWLIDNNKTDTLLSIKSHFLENYLKRCTALHPENIHSLDLLWKFYEKNQNFSAAARVLAKLADKHGVEMTLPQRLEYLSRAIMCVKSSEMRVTAGGEGEFLHELEEKMEVARIQLQMLETLQQKKIPGVHDSISRLNSNFQDITQLYEDFAVPYDLPESKLAIVHCAGHYDPSLIESLWQSIIDKELVSTCGNLPETRIKILQQKIQSISQTYISSEKYFPVAFIVKYLEFKTSSLNFDLNFVYQTMMSLGLSLVDLLSIYHKMYRAKDSCWHAVKKPLHILQVLSLLIGQFSNTPSVISQNERRTFVTLCLDVIAGYLVDLQAMSTTDPTVPSLMKEFKSIQHTLERLL